MKKHIIYCALIFASIFSCSKENNTQEIQNPNDLSQDKIKTFDDFEDFKNTLDLLSSFNDSSDFENWSHEEDYISAYDSDKISIEDKNKMPFTYLFILNENKEFLIGDKLINYSEGFFYENTIDDSGNLIKENKVIGSFKEELFTLNETEIEDSGTNSTRVVLDATNGTLYKPTSGWREFNRNKYRSYCGTPINKSLKYRLVHYLGVETVDLGGTIQSSVKFKLRMSHKGGSDWVLNNTTTERLYNVNISGTCKMIYIDGNQAGQTQFFSINSSNNCSNPLKGLKIFPLADLAFFTPTNISLYKWEVTLNGSVYHKVNGDTQAFSTSVNW